MTDHSEDAVVERVAFAMMGWNQTALTDVQRTRLDMAKYDLKRAFAALRPGDHLPGGGVWAPAQFTPEIDAAIIRTWELHEVDGWLDAAGRKELHRAMLSAAGAGK
jgi:hypothetical protein